MIGLKEILMLIILLIKKPRNKKERKKKKAPEISDFLLNLYYNMIKVGVHTHVYVHAHTLAIYLGWLGKLKTSFISRLTIDCFINV